jgi:hypothetical protein
MNSPRILYQLARADFWERVRRYSFLLTLLFAIYLGYATATGKVSLRLGDYRGVYTSAWIGVLVSLVTTCFVSLVGFYIVKNSIDRDRQTRVGQVLASTPLTKVEYLVGKWLSNFAVLALMVLILALAAVAMQILHGEDSRFDLWAMLSPFLLLALPAMALTAAIALLFESISFLRGGFGNIVWFFMWTFGIALPILTKIPVLDPMGFYTVFSQLGPAARANIPGYDEGFSLTIANQWERPAKLATWFRWQGIRWTPDVVLTRLMWLAIALVIVLVAALFFDRFDSSRALLPRMRGAKEPEAVSLPATPAPSRRNPSVHLTPLQQPATSFAFPRVLKAELLLAVKGHRWWWYAVAAGLLIAQLASPLEVSRGPLLGAAWLWPVLLWSAMGSRETRFATGQLVFSSARILSRQLPACWTAGVAVALLVGGGAALRLLLAGQTAGLLAWIAAAVFIPALALALGVWSGTGKVFEGLYTALWYIGPMNRVPGLDFTGAANGANTAHYAVIYLALAAVLLAAAFLGRQRQLRAA